MVNNLNKKTKSGLHLTSKQMKDQFKTYQSRYGKVKKESSSTGFGLTEEDQSKAAPFSAPNPLISCSPFYKDQNPAQIFRFPKEDEDIREGEYINQPATNSDIITNDIPVPPLATPINTSTSQKTSNSWNLNHNNYQKTTKSAQPSTTYAELYEAKTDHESHYESGRISWEQEKWSFERELQLKQVEITKEVEYEKLEYAKEEKDKELFYKREEKEKGCEFKLLLAEKEKEALKK
ncbi:hypothetical protein BY996DRAFT_6609157 [Phakopsora pachyrhizi]|nr:hypothetical protein BY996DRAFT_6609157 [Phakopsora pachyrhizi]